MLQAKCALLKQFPSDCGFFGSFYSCQSPKKHFLEVSLEPGGLLETHVFSPHNLTNNLVRDVSNN